MPRSIALLCLFIFCCTFSVGAFPVLIPEIGRDAAIGDVALGFIAGAFGLARLLADLPAGLLITHHLRRALVFAAACLVLGIVCLVLNGPVWLLVLGRFFWGIGHALAMVGGITAIVRHAASGRGSFYLSAFEMSGMCGVLFGMVLTGLLPGTWPWTASLALASSPLLVAVAIVPWLLSKLPPDTKVASRPATPNETTRSAQGTAHRSSNRARSLLAVASGATIAIAWSAIGQFVLPLRASREFDFDRIGVALLVALPQVVDVALLLPMGAVADRTSRTRVLGVVMAMLAIAVVSIALGQLWVVVVGAVLLGAGMAAWMLPVSLVNQGAAPESIAWRTARYRLAVDAGIFLGPVLGGVLLASGMLEGAALLLAFVLLVLGLALLGHRDKT